MKITVLGATGNAGTAIVEEATRRGHDVVAASRHPHPASHGNVTTMTVDLAQPEALHKALAGADAAVLAVRLPPGDEPRLAPLTSGVLDQAARAGVRVLVVGGAGPLRSPHDPNTRVLDDPAYVPPQWRDIATASLHQLRACENHHNQDWTYLSPSADFEPGKGTGAYRRGDTTLLTNTDGTSHITTGDLATAVLDELEHPGTQRHFTVIETDTRIIRQPT